MHGLLTSLTMGPFRGTYVKNCIDKVGVKIQTKSLKH